MLFIYEFASGGQFGIERQIFHYRKVWEDRKILIDYLNAQIDGLQWRNAGIGFSGKFNGAGIRRVYAADYLDQGRFSASVFTGEAVNLARLDFERYAGKRLYARE